MSGFVIIGRPIGQELAQNWTGLHTAVGGLRDLCHRKVAISATIPALIVSSLESYPSPDRCAPPTGVPVVFCSKSTFSPDNPAFAGQTSDLNSCAGSVPARLNSSEGTLAHV